jgi:ribosomal 50S subunit-recycling heat shock protein
MINSGNCGLVIRGHELNFNEIQNNLKIKPSRAVKKGEVISKVVGESEYDLWVYEIKLNEAKKPDQILEDLLSILNPHKAYIQNIAKYADVRMKCYVQSDYAQIYFELSPNVIKELASMEIKLEISILSWGGVTS